MLTVLALDDSEYSVSVDADCISGRSHDNDHAQ